MSASLIGLVVACIIRPPYPYFKFTIIHIGIGLYFLHALSSENCRLLIYQSSCVIYISNTDFNAGNIGNIPLVLISALCRDPSNPLGDSSKCNQDGNAYISFGQWVCLFLLFFWSCTCSRSTRNSKSYQSRRTAQYSWWAYEC